MTNIRRGKYSLTSRYFFSILAKDSISQRTESQVLNYSDYILRKQSHWTPFLNFALFTNKLSSFMYYIYFAHRSNIQFSSQKEPQSDINKQVSGISQVVRFISSYTICTTYQVCGFRLVNLLLCDSVAYLQDKVSPSTCGVVM